MVGYRHNISKMPLNLVFNVNIYSDVDNTVLDRPQPTGHRSCRHRCRSFIDLVYIF